MTPSAGGPSILLVGCGKMGSALMTGWLSAMPSVGIHIVEPNGVAGCPPDRVHVVADAADLPHSLAPDILVLAVKPQMLPAVAPAYRSYVSAGAAVLTIAVGKTIAAYEGWYGSESAIVRAMPNTPAAIGRGVTGAVANAHVSPAQRDLADRLLAAAGEVVWLEDEHLMDALSAVSGSGPAYVFLLVEVLAAAGTRAGLPGDLAMRLARATVAGSGELLRRAAEPAEQLRRDVTSPNGTTAAALAVLMGENGMQPLFDAAIAAAVARAQVLAAP